MRRSSVLNFVTFRVHYATIPIFQLSKVVQRSDCHWSSDSIWLKLPLRRSWDQNNTGKASQVHHFLHTYFLLMLPFNHAKESETELVALVPRQESLGGKTQQQQHRYYDKKDSRGTRNLHIFGLVISYVVAIVSILVGFLAAGGPSFKLKPIPRELITLGIEAAVTVVTESLGSIHGTSLRWALFHENRLEFNTNLRLFTATHHAPNSIVSNAIFLFGMAVCYAAGSLVLVSNTYSFYLSDGGYGWDLAKEESSLSKVALVSLGVSTLALCALSTWSLLAIQMPTWSSNPLTTAAIVLDRGVQRQDGRCMIAVHDRNKPSEPHKPRTSQRSLYAASFWVRRILIILAAPTIFFAAWTGLIAWVNKNNTGGGNWNIFAQPAFDTDTNPTDSDTIRAFTPTVFLVFFLKSTDSGGPPLVPESTMLGVLLFRTALQSIVTIGLHCTDVLVSMFRDEQAWRALATRKGSITDKAYSSNLYPFKSWPYVALFAFKPFIHWMFGQAVGFDYAKGVLMRVPHLTYLTSLWLVLVAFAIFLSARLPEGPLPASYGHLQTIVDVVDEWTPKMYWGDKGAREFEESGNIRHAGTSDLRLDGLYMDMLYS